MKKILKIGLVSCMLIALTGCSNKDKDNLSNESSSNIKSITYVFNEENKKFDTTISLLSNDLNLITIDALKDIVASLQNSGRVNKISLDIDKSSEKQ